MTGRGTCDKKPHMRLPSSLLCALFLIGSAALADPAAPGPLVAVMELKNKLKGAQKEEVDVGYLTDLVRSAVKREVRGARVMTRENVIVLLQNQGKKLEDCESECEVETGRKLGADLIVSGEVLKFGSAFKVSLKLHDTREGQLLSGEMASGGSLDELDREVPQALRKLVAPLAPARAQAAAQPAPQRPAPSRPVLPPAADPDAAARARAREAAAAALVASPPQPPQAPAPQPQAPAARPEEQVEEVRSRAPHWEFSLLAGYATDPDPCRGLTVTACNATTTGYALEMHASYAMQVGNLRAGLGAGISSTDLKLESTLSALPSKSTNDYRLLLSLPLDLAFGEFTVGWTPYLRVHLSGDHENEELLFHYARFQAAWGKDFRLMAFLEAPISSQPWLVGGGIVLKL